MEAFIFNMFIASFGLIIAGGIFISILNWLQEEFLSIAKMNLSDWIGFAVFLGIAALIAQSM